MPDVLDVHASHAVRARAFHDDPSSVAVVPARPAATVVLLRDTQGDEAPGPEVYLLRRAPSMAFAAGMHVFPGGSVDPRDSDSDGDSDSGDSGASNAAGWAGPSPREWAALLGCDEFLARALVSAAVRETFEESAVLLAGPDAGALVEDTGAEDIEADRLALLDRSLSMSELLTRRRLVLRGDLLRPLAHWVTPEFEAKRFDTWFFVAGAPPRQRARDVSGEADATMWLPVRAAVRRHDQGDLVMLPPTIEALRDVARYDTVAEVLAAPRSLRRILPRPVLSAGRLMLDLGD